MNDKAWVVKIKYLDGETGFYGTLDPVIFSSRTEAWATALDIKVYEESVTDAQVQERAA